MYTSTLDTPKPDDLERVCAFTLATALAWIGHDCSGGCPPEAATMRASVWFIRLATLRAITTATTLVVVDLGDSATEPAPVRAMLRQVNACAQADHIRVRERVSSRHGRRVAAFADPSSSTGAFLYLRAEPTMPVPHVAPPEMPMTMSGQL